MKIGICDDDVLDLALLEGVVRSVIQDHDTLLCCKHGAELLESHYERPFDILFLDICMPHLNGIAAARELRRTCQSTLIILVTQYRDYAVESYEIQAFSYLGKPLKRALIVEVFQKARKQRERIGRQIAITNHYEIIYISVNDIVYAESVQNNIYIYTHHKTLSTRMTIKELYKELEADGFARVHKSYIINLAYVSGIGKRVVLMDCNKEIPIGKTRSVLEIKATVAAFRRLQP